METEIPNNTILPMMKVEDRTWIQGLDPADRVAGLAFLAWKNHKSTSIDKESKPACFMRGFEVGCGYAAKIITGDIDRAKNSETPPEPPGAA